MTAFLALVAKDLRLFAGDRRALLTSIVAPILLAAFFGTLFGGAGGGAAPTRVPVVVTDLDRGALSTGLVAALRADPALAVTEAGAADNAARVVGGKARAGIVLPAGFGAGAVAAPGTGVGRPEITLRYDPSQPLVLPLVRGLLARHALDAIGRSARRAGGADAAALLPQLPFSTREIEAAARPEARYNAHAHAFAGMGVQFILMMGVDMAVGLLAMRRMGLWQRLRAAPLSRAGLLGSRLASTALIALGVFAVVYAVAIAGFGVRVEGSAVGFALLLVAFALFAASFGLVVAAFGKTPETTRGLAILATLLLVMLGGAWVPAFIFPAWLQAGSLAVPTRWAIDGLDAMTWRGQPLQAAWPPIAVMLGSSAVCTALALWRFDWDG